MTVVDANELTDRITVRLAGMNQRRKKRRFIVATASFFGLVTTLVFAAALIWILTD